MTSDCGHFLSSRARDIEYLARTVCDIDRGRWSSSLHRETTPTVRRRLATELDRLIAGVPPEHCPSCGCPASEHSRHREFVRMGSGR